MKNQNTEQVVYPHHLHHFNELGSIILLALESGVYDTFTLLAAINNSFGIRNGVGMQPHNALRKIKLLSEDFPGYFEIHQGNLLNVTQYPYELQLIASAMLDISVLLSSHPDKPDEICLSDVLGPPKEKIWSNSITILSALSELSESDPQAQFRQVDIQKRAGLSEPVVRKRLHALADLGLIYHQSAGNQVYARYSVSPNANATNGLTGSESQILHFLISFGPNGLEEIRAGLEYRNIHTVAEILGKLRMRGLVTSRFTFDRQSEVSLYVPNDSTSEINMFREKFMRSLFEIIDNLHDQNFLTTHYKPSVAYFHSNPDILREIYMKFIDKGQFTNRSRKRKA